MYIVSRVYTYEIITTLRQKRCDFSLKKEGQKSFTCCTYIMRELWENLYSVAMSKSECVCFFSSLPMYCLDRITQLVQTIKKQNGCLLIYSARDMILIIPCIPELRQNVVHEVAGYGTMFVCVFSKHVARVKKKMTGNWMRRS